MENKDLYSAKETKHIKKAVSKYVNNILSLFEEYLLKDEQVRILKKHFRLSNSELSEIINKNRIPSNNVKEILKLLNKD